MTEQQYSYIRLAHKVIVSALAVIVPGELSLQALPDDAQVFAASWVLYAGALAYAIFRAGMNLYKNRDLPGNPLSSLPGGGGGAPINPALPATLLAITLSSLLAGCATSVTTRFSETVTDENGYPTTTTYEVESRGDVEETVHDFSYRYGGEENVIAVGQAAVGVTSPAQVDSIRALLSLPSDVLRSLIPVAPPDGVDE